MKTFILIPVAFLIFFCQSVSLSGQSKIVISEFSLLAGESTINFKNITFNKLSQLAPNSTILDRDFSDFGGSSGYYSFTTMSSFSALLGLQFRNKENLIRRNPVLRLGINYSSGPAFYSSVFRTESQIIDTFISQQTGEEIYIESNTNEHVSIEYNSEKLGLDGSLIFRTNTDSRFSFYTGIGITSGFSINAFTTVSNAVNTYNTSFNHSYYSGNSTGSYKMEEFKNKNSFNFESYLPIGVDFKLSKKNRLLKQTHIFYEGRPGISLVSIPELETIVNTNLQNNIGIKIAWN